MAILNPSAGYVRRRILAGRRAYAIFWLPWLLVTCFSFLAPNAGAAVSREYQLKAVLLLNLLRFVEWPATAFDAPSNPLVIGVLGDDPFGAALDEAIRGEIIHDRPVVVRRYHSVEDIGACHLLFINRNQRREFRNILQRLNTKTILTVSDTRRFIREGGLLELFTKSDGRIGIRVDVESAKSAGLTVSSKLMLLAENASTERD